MILQYENYNWKINYLLDGLKVNISLLTNITKQINLRRGGEGYK